MRRHGASEPIDRERAAGRFLRGAGEADRDDAEREQRAERQLAFGDEVAARQQQRRVGPITCSMRSAMVIQRVAMPASISRSRSELLSVGEARALALLAPERLRQHHSRTGPALAQVRGQLRELTLHALARVVDRAPAAAQPERHERRDHERQQRQLPVQVHHHRDRHDGGERAVEQAQQRRAQDVVDTPRRR